MSFVHSYFPRSLLPPNHSRKIFFQINFIGFSNGVIVYYDRKLRSTEGDRFNFFKETAIKQPESPTKYRGPLDQFT
tara:strand:+ start:6524 stop:6751 length:228 start_codon:yes stop_codon:yes gene_type:complete